MADTKESKKLSDAAERKIAAAGPGEQDIVRQRLEHEAEAASHVMTTPDGDKGHPIPGELGYRAEFWQDKDEELRRPV